MSTSYPQSQVLYLSFREHLVASGVSRNTIKNYSSDITHFLNWLDTHATKQGVNLNSPIDGIILWQSEVITYYKKFVDETIGNTNSANRKLSSVRKFSLFIKNSGLLNFDFAGGIANIKDQEVLGNPVLINFRKYLLASKASANTTKNYVSDIKNYLSWREQNTSSDKFDLITSQMANSYLQSLPGGQPRKAASLKKLAEWSGTAIDIVEPKTIEPVTYQTRSTHELQPLELHSEYTAPSIPNHAPNHRQPKVAATFAVAALMGLAVLGGGNVRLSDYSLVLADNDTKITQPSAQFVNFRNDTGRDMGGKVLGVRENTPQTISFSKVTDSKIQTLRALLPSGPIEGDGIGDNIDSYYLLNISEGDLDTNVTSALYINPEQIIQEEIASNTGNASLPSGVDTIYISSQGTTTDSLIYLTPTTSTQNKVLYIKEKGIGYFIVGIDGAIPTDINFSWWVQN